MGPRLIGGLTLYAHSFGNDKAYPEVHHTDRAVWVEMPHRKERGNAFILHLFRLVFARNNHLVHQDDPTWGRVLHQSIVLIP